MFKFKRDQSGARVKNVSHVKMIIFEGSYFFWLCPNEGESEAYTEVMSVLAKVREGESDVNSKVSLSTQR